MVTNIEVITYRNVAMNDSSEAVCDTRTVISNPRRITADWTIEYPPEILELSKRTDLTKIAST